MNIAHNLFNDLIHTGFGYAVAHTVMTEGITLPEVSSTPVTSAIITVLSLAFIKIANWAINKYFPNEAAEIKKFEKDLADQPGPDQPTNVTEDKPNGKSL
jgi:hypothetical protein